MTLLDTAHTLTITIAGVDVGAWLVTGSLRITTVLGAELDSCNFELEDYGGLGPVTSWAEVIVTDETATKLFAGYAATVTSQVIQAGYLRWSITALDYGVMFQKRIVDRAFVDTHAGTIIDTLVQDELTGYDSTTYVSAGKEYSIRFDRRTLFDCIKDLADKDGFQWWVDVDKKLHYLLETDGAEAPFAIADVTACNWTTTFPVSGPNLSVEEDATDIRNDVTVHGGVAISQPVTENFIANGTQVNFIVSQTPINAVGVVTLDGVVQTVGRDYIDDPAKFNCMVNWTYGKIMFADPPAAGVSVSVTYTYDDPVRSVVQDLASQALYGRQEYIHVDPAIADESHADMLATAILQRYRYPDVRGRLTVERAGLAAGQQLAITCAALGWTNEVFMIQQCVLTQKRGGLLVCDVQFGGREPSLLDALRGIAGGSGGVAAGGIGSGAGTALGQRLDLRQPTAYQYIEDVTGARYLVPVYNVTVGSGELDLSDADSSGYVALL